MSVEAAERPEGLARATPAELDARLADLYRAHFAELVRLAAFLTGRPDVAEELAQDAFVKLRGRLHKVEQPKAYLRATVVNSARSHARRLGVELRHLVRLRRAEHADASGHELFDVLAQLPTNERIALVLRYYEDRTDEEIAEIIGCRPATVRSHLHRGIARLREALR